MKMIKLEKFIVTEFGRISFVGDKVACFLNDGTCYDGYLKEIANDLIFIKTEENAKQILIDEIKTMDVLIECSSVRRGLL